MIGTALKRSHFTAKTELDDLLFRIITKLQITETMHQDAVSKYQAVGNWLNDDERVFAKLDPLIYPQGSLRIGTSVKPKFQTEYDLDLVLELRKASHTSFPNPVKLLDSVEERIKEHAVYRKIYERKNRCIRICYANDFHLDILPACPDKQMGGTCLWVPDRAMKDWKPSNPKGYAKWFEEQLIEKAVKMQRQIEPVPGREEVEDKAALKQAVQLIKRNRDVRYAKNVEVAPISIVLTTLAAEHYSGESSVGLALLSILNGIVSSLPIQGRLHVFNPSNHREDLSERWDSNPASYQAFVQGIMAFRQEWEDLMLAAGKKDVASKLSQLFGEQLTDVVVKEQALEMEAKRRQGGLAVAPSSGRIVSATSVGATPIRMNTFYGK
jgi:hypothetical protein